LVLKKLLSVEDAAKELHVSVEEFELKLKNMEG